VETRDNLTDFATECLRLQR